MGWSAKLGRFAGIDVFVHVTFLALLAWLGAVFWARTGTVAGVLSGLAVVVALFACVLLHEYGHALTARRFGIRTRHITLLPIGGVAVLEAMPRNPWQEIVVALAGPAVNLAIAGVVQLAIVARGQADGLFAGGLTGMGLLSSLVAANLALALFNLLPAFPMDGGRVLRAALSLRTDRATATRIAAIVGRAMAVGLGLMGLAGNPVLVLIAVFVWIGAGAEARATAAEDGAAGLPAARAMVTGFAALPPETPVSRALALAESTGQPAFPVVSGGRPVGVARRRALAEAARVGPDRPVAEVMAPAVTADAATPLGAVARSLAGPGDGFVCLVEGGRLVGVLDPASLAAFLRGRAATGRR